MREHACHRTTDKSPTWMSCMSSYPHKSTCSVLPSSKELMVWKQKKAGALAGGRGGRGGEESGLRVGQGSENKLPAGRGLEVVVPRWEAVVLAAVVQGRRSGDVRGAARVRRTTAEQTQRIRTDRPAG